MMMSLNSIRRGANTSGKLSVDQGGTIRTTLVGGGNIRMTPRLSGGGGGNIQITLLLGAQSVDRGKTVCTVYAPYRDVVLPARVLLVGVGLLDGGLPRPLRQARVDDTSAQFASS